MKGPPTTPPPPWLVARYRNRGPPSTPPPPHLLGQQRLGRDDPISQQSFLDEHQKIVVWPSSEGSWASSDEPRPKAPEPSVREMPRNERPKPSSECGVEEFEEPLVRVFRGAADELRSAIRTEHRRIETVIDTMLTSLETTTDLEAAIGQVRRISDDYRSSLRWAV